MGTTTALTLVDRLSQSIGDYISEAVTTNIAANAYIVSTHLNKWDGGEDNTFKDWWVYIASQNNNGKERRARTYAASNATINVFGGNLVADTNIADIRLGQYSYIDKLRSINDAIQETFPTLHRPIVDTSIISVTNTYEYNLPTNLAMGEVSKIFWEDGGTTNTTAQQFWSLIYGWRILDDGSQKKFRLPFNPTNAITFRLEGIAPFSTLAGSSNSIETDLERELALLTAYAEYKLYDRLEQPVATLDTKRYETQSMKAYRQYIMLKMTAQKPRPTTTLHLGGV